MSDDLNAIGADDALVERLRRSLSPDGAVVWGDDEDELDDAPYALLRALQRDVSSGADLLPLAGRRRLGRRATVAAIAAGVLSVSSVAAAATAPPLAGVRSAVASAVQQVVDAVTPSAPIGPVVAPVPETQQAPAPRKAPTAQPTPSAPGRQISASARAVNASRQVQDLLDSAARLVHDKRYVPAGQLLDQAERRLDLVPVSARAGYRTQIADLRAEIDAATASQTKPATAKPGPRPSRPAKARSAKAQPAKTAGRSDLRHGTAAATQRQPLH